jgi:hypothetical protein
MEKHRLANGASVCSLSAHGFKFSDGTESKAQDQTLVDFFTLKRNLSKKASIMGMDLNEVRMELSTEQLEKLKEVSNQVDLVIVPFPVLTALREQGVRVNYPNVVAFNATRDTQRSAPQEKIVDVSNWSY